MECIRQLARFIEFNFSDQHAICLNSRVREFEGSVIQTIVWRGRRGNCPVLQRAGPSMLCNMLGERSQTSLHLLILRDLPHTYSCTCFYSKKSEKCFKHQFFWENPGYLPVVLCLWSQARPCEFILHLPWWCSSQLYHHLLIDHSSSKASAPRQPRALQRYYDKQNQIQPSKRALTLRWS